MGSTEQSINEEEVFDQTCGRNVQKKPIYRRGPGDSGMTLILTVMIMMMVMKMLVMVTMEVTRTWLKISHLKNCLS